MKIRAMRYGHKFSFIAHLVLAGALLLTAVALQAERDGERVALTRLLDSIERLEPLIQRAEREAEPAARVQFRYDWLRRDLSEVKAGIEAYLMDAELTPRTFEPLQGDYHQ